MNRPIHLTDPMGLWPTPVHTKILYTALSDYLLPSDIAELDRVSQNQDAILKGGQDVANSYMHHMRNGYSETSDDAEIEYEAFLESSLAVALESIAVGNKDAAIQSLGENFHALADSTSPAHSCVAARMYGDATTRAPECSRTSDEDFRPWYSIYDPRHWFLTVSQHEREENYDSGPAIDAAVNKIRQYYVLYASASYGARFPTVEQRLVQGVNAQWTVEDLGGLASLLAFASI